MLKVLKAGFFTSIQDGGRTGYLNKGVPVSGVMDSFSASRLNVLLDNENNAAVMEVTMTGPTLVFYKPTFICVGGAVIAVTLNNNPIKHFKVYKIEKGDVLSYGRLKKGFRNYVAIKHGFQVPQVLGSRSFYRPVTHQSHLADGATIDYISCDGYTPQIAKDVDASILDKTRLAVSRGPEFKLLNDKKLEQIFSKTFSVAKAYNRMAYQLEQPILGHTTSMLTSATLPGTVQYTPSGQLIVLMKDGQTTGGYPRILQLSDDAISIVAQKKFGDSISFRLI